MTRVLSPETLEAALTLGRAALPIVRNVAALDSLLRSIRSGQTQGSLEGPESRWARARLEHNRPLLGPEGQTLLDAADLYVIPHMYHGAQAIIEEQRRTLIVFRGLFDAIIYYSAASQFIAALPDGLDEIIPYASLPAIGVRAAIAVALPIFLVHFARDMMALPPLFGILTKKQQEVVIGAVDSALIFIVCHELGHFELGHLASNRGHSRSVLQELLIGERLSDFQREEMDADEFAMGLLTDTAKGLAPNGIATALGPLSFFEPLLPQRPETHPLSVNRIAHIARLAEEHSRQASMPQMQPFLGNMAQSIGRIVPLLDKTRGHGADPFDAGLNRVDLLEMLADLNPHLLRIGLDLRPALDAVPPVEGEQRSALRLFQ